MIWNGRRNRMFYFVGFVLILALGFTSRLMDHLLTEFLETYLPDTLWGLMVFVGLGMLFTKLKTIRVTMFALLFAYGIECSQLLQNAALIEIRNTTFGGLVLGHGFLWSDLVCYTVGIFIGACVETFIQKQRKAR